MARRILGGAIVPAAPALLEAASPRQPEEVRAGLELLREEVSKTLAALPSTDVVVLLDTGPRGIHQRARADLSSLGLQDVQVDLTVPADLVATATRITQYPLVGSERLSVSSAVMALLVEDVIGPVPVVVTTVSARAEGAMLAHVGAGLVEAVRASNVTGVIVANGDLSTSLHEESPGYVVPGAAGWDRDVFAAVAAHDLDRLNDLGPAAASEFTGRGWAAIVAGHGAFSAARLRPEGASYHAPLGVGQLVARFEQQEAGEPGGRFRRDRDAP